MITIKPKTMRIISLVVLLLLGAGMSYSQTTLEEAKANLKEMDDVVNFTSEQKQEIIEIFKTSIQASRALSSQSFEEKKEYLKAKSQLMVDARKSIYPLCTPEQIAAYKQYRKLRQMEFKDMIAKRNHSQEYSASKQ